MASFYLDPVVSMIPATSVQPLSPFPITWGGLSVNNYLPVFPLGVGSPFPGPTVGRSFYGSVFYPYFGSSGTPMSRWGDEWYTPDLLSTGARLAYWGESMTATDPWRMPYYWDRLQRQNSNPSPSPQGWLDGWIPKPFNFFGAPPAAISSGSAPSVSVSNSGKGQPRSGSAEEASPSGHGAPDRRTPPDTHEPPPTGRGTPPPPSTPPSTGHTGRGPRTGRRGRGATPLGHRPPTPEAPRVLYTKEQLQPLKLENLTPEIREDMQALLNRGGIVVEATNPNGILWIAPGGEVFKLTKSRGTLLMTTIGIAREDKIYSLSQ